MLKKVFRIKILARIYINHTYCRQIEPPAVCLFCNQLRLRSQILRHFLDRTHLDPQLTEGPSQSQPVKRLKISIQCDSLFHFTQRDTMYNVFQAVYIINKLYIQSGLLSFILFMMYFLLICMSCGNREGISYQPCSSLMNFGVQYSMIMIDVIAFLCSRCFTSGAYNE